MSKVAVQFSVIPSIIIKYFSRGECILPFNLILILYETFYKQSQNQTNKTFVVLD